MLDVETAVDRAKGILGRSKIRELRKLAVERVGEGVAIHGFASSIYHKQLAQELVRKELDGEEVLNHIQVIHRLPGSARK